MMNKLPLQMYPPNRSETKQFQDKCWETAWGDLKDAVWVLTILTIQRMGLTKKLK